MQILQFIRVKRDRVGEDARASEKLLHNVNTTSMPCRENFDIPISFKNSRSYPSSGDRLTCRYLSLLRPKNVTSVWLLNPRLRNGIHRASDSALKSFKLIVPQARRQAGSSRGVRCSSNSPRPPAFSSGPVWPNYRPGGCGSGPQGVRVAERGVAARAAAAATASKTTM